MLAKRYTLFLAVVFAVVLGLGFASQRAAASTNQASWPLNYTYYDSCFGEWIAVEGKIHYTWSYVSDGNGGYHYRSHQNYAGVRGTGLSSGLKYTANGSYNYNFNAKSPWPYVYSAHYRFRWNQQGGGSNTYQATTTTRSTPTAT
jgi:hypothetical protein